MIGILVQLILSAALLWFLQKKSLMVLCGGGMKQQSTDFFGFFLLTLLISSSQYFFRMIWAMERWVVNPKVSIALIAEGTWWNIKSVLFEELIFRGALFYILIVRLGIKWAILLSSISFGVYHWFSHGVLGQPIPMIVEFLTTGIMGVVYALGYTKTGSLLTPIGIHLGWNIVGSVLFSGKLIGDQLLVEVQPVPNVQVSYFIYFVIIYLPLLAAIGVNAWILLKRPTFSFNT
ncbi:MULTISPECIES: lysostaphin resistance A-like protein [unclassified Paraflavitalea]|uniref:CPBP family intramembrane glutamic endopeptidase n=1 Tax=unclassified Paraflavitalea TaxID=2798305 RepID=UPI003D34B4CC